MPTLQFEARFLQKLSAGSRSVPFGGGRQRLRRGEEEEPNGRARGGGARSRRRRCLSSERRGEGRANRWDFPHCASPGRLPIPLSTLKHRGRRIARAGQVAGSSSAPFPVKPVRSGSEQQQREECAVCASPEGRKEATAVA